MDPSGVVYEIASIDHNIPQRRRQSTGTRGIMSSFLGNGAHGERVERESITGVWGQSHQRVPWSGVRKEAKSF